MLSNWDPWACIPHSYNAGLDLSTEQVVRGRGDRVALHWENAAGARCSLTYRELDERSTALACALRRMGVGAGDRVLLRLPNIPEFYIAAIAALKNGSIFIPTSTQFRTRSRVSPAGLWRGGCRSHHESYGRGRRGGAAVL